MGERERYTQSPILQCGLHTSAVITSLQPFGEAAMLEVGTKMVHTDPWRADELDHAAERLDWAAKDAHKPAGTFDADYASLCQVFQVPPHPCLASRRAKATTEDETKPPVASSTVQLQNFAVDLTTLRLMMEALKRSSDIDTLTFHNAGLTEASIAILVEGLQHTSVHSLGLDYNTLLPSSSPVRPKVTDGAAEAAEGSANEAASGRNFAGLVREGSKLKALSLRGNGIGDVEAAALAEAIEENTVLRALNLFDNKITDVGAFAFAEMLRLNTVLRGLSLAKNRLIPTSAEAFGLLLAGGYEVLAPEQEKRAAAEAKITAQNKIAQDAMKKKKDAKVETRLPLSAVVLQTGGDGSSKAIAGGSKSLAALNLSENRELGADGALVNLLSRIVKARKEEAEGAGAGVGFGAGAGAVVLQELHLARCQGYGEEAGGEDGDSMAVGDQAGMLAAMSFALRPTKVVV